MSASVKISTSPWAKFSLQAWSRFVLVLAVFILLGFETRAEEIAVTVDKTTQRLTVEVDGVIQYRWAVSTARRGYLTPNGSYRPEWLARKWFSREYDWSPMPYSIFFSGGYAIHGSYEISNLGSPASHGCIRLHPENAAILFALVRSNMNSTRIVVTGESSNVGVRASGATRKPKTKRKVWWERPFFYCRAPHSFVA